MFTVSLHDIRIHGKHGLYPEEAVLGNWFEVDVDICIAVKTAEEWPFIDYTTINGVVHEVFATPTKLLETLVRSIHNNLKAAAPSGAVVKVAIRKMHPPMPGDVGYAQVQFEG